MNSVEKFIYPKNNSFGIITSYLSKTIILILPIFCQNMCLKWL